MARIDFVTGNAQIYLPEVEALAGIPDELEAVLDGHANAGLRATGADGRSAARIIGDMVAYAEHDREALHRMSWMTDPVIRPLNVEGAAISGRWELRNGSELLAQLTTAMAETVEVLKEQPDAAWGRPGLFDSGRRSIRQQARHSVTHYREELERLSAVLSGGS